MYPEIDRNEREQIEWVFGLTGGELNDKPLRYANLVCCMKHPEYERHWAPYFYDGVPEYARRIEYKLGGSFMTVVHCALYGSEMPRVIYAGGKRWRKIATYTSSGETECPGKDFDSPSRPCPLCEAREGEEHGMIYIGEGWAEVVYRARG